MLLTRDISKVGQSMLSRGTVRGCLAIRLSTVAVLIVVVGYARPAILPALETHAMLRRARPGSFLGDVVCGRAGMVLDRGRPRDLVRHRREESVWGMVGASGRMALWHRAKARQLFLLTTCSPQHLRICSASPNSIPARASPRKGAVPSEP